jgi:hypothetical protein
LLICLSGIINSFLTYVVVLQEVANELPIVQNKKERHRASLKYYFLKPNSFTI